jgi:hypothetical protein
MAVATFLQVILVFPVLFFFGDVFQPLQSNQPRGRKWYEPH